MKNNFFEEKLLNGLKVSKKIVFLNSTDELIHFHTKPSNNDIICCDNIGFNLNDFLNFKIIIKKHKMYNGYTISYNYNNTVFDLCNNFNFTLTNMSKNNFLEKLKTDFNAIPKNHYKVFFRTEEDAKNVVEWIDSFKLAYKMKEEIM